MLKLDVRTQALFPPNHDPRIAARRAHAPRRRTAGDACRLGGQATGSGADVRGGSHTCSTWGTEGCMQVVREDAWTAHCVWIPFAFGNRGD